MDLAGPGLHVTENCGIKIPPQTTDQTIKGIAEALERLYGDPELVARMGKAARHRAEEAYVLDKLGDRLRGIYESVLGAKIQDGVMEVGSERELREGSAG
jgi:glycosyltransferase involved in cell wall biosynthesis